jgi:hypothetical protein
MKRTLAALILLSFLSGCDTSANEEKANSKQVRELVRGEGLKSREQDDQDAGGSDAGSIEPADVHY